MVEEVLLDSVDDLDVVSPVDLVATGKFQEHMIVALENDGPVTLMLDSADRQRPRRS